MTTKTVIELTEEDLKAILCEKFGYPKSSAKLDIIITKGDRPGELDDVKIVFEAEKILIIKK